MEALKNVKMNLCPRSFIITLLAVISTAVCVHFEIYAEFPLTLIATAIIFPIVFSISGAYKRREVVLREYGNMKAHGRAMYFASRDWLETPDPQIQDNIKTHLGEFFTLARDFFKTTADHKEATTKEKQVYELFRVLSHDVKSMRAVGLPSGEASRCNQFLSKIIISFETVKHIFQYRTPRSLRAYSRVFIAILPIIYGPYFAVIAKDFSPGLTYIMPILFTLVLTALDNIQEHLENPFDQIGQDDVSINPEKFVELLDA